MNSNHDLHDERISKLYKLGNNSEPPEHLDREIKRAARAETSTRKRRFTWPSLATAAVLVLSISLVLKVLQQEPMEDAVLEPSITNGEVITPNAMLQEKEIAEESMDSEEPKLQRYRDIKQRAAAPARLGKADSLQLEAAPASTEELLVTKAVPSECYGIELPETDSRAEWIRLYQESIKSGQAETANCIQQIYRSRFKQAMPITLEK